MVLLGDFLFTRYLGELADFVEGEICKVLGVAKEIKKLHKTLEKIKPYLQSADEMRHENEDINRWVSRLKDMMYDIEDIIDDCMIEGRLWLKTHPSSASSSSSSMVTVSSCFSLLPSCFACTRYRHKIAHRIEELNSRSEEIEKDRQVTSMLVQWSTTTHRDTREHGVTETTPLEVKGDIVGTQIEEATEDLINRLIVKDKEERGCTVLGIVGMAGIGKTTLARKVMNDDRIEENFPIRIWLHVSKNYSEIGLLKKIVKRAKENDEGAEDKEELEAKVVCVLSQKFFIVLDDVWSINVWNDLLRTPIFNAAVANNGKILVTSRNEIVLRGMKASYTHHVKGMKEDDGWKLLCKMVFEDGDSNGNGLDAIGREIVRLCGGLPLAIKVMAGVLVSKEKSRREWEKVLESSSWEMNRMDAEVPKALYLSYEDLPSYLKECFLSCALYNGITYSPDLARLWVAEGLVAEQGNMLMEEVAEEYYKQLVRRNLLQLDPLSLHKTCYSMHDLLRSLGTYLIREEGIILTDDQNIGTNPLTKIRRLSLSNKGDMLTLPSAIKRQKCLRVLHLYDGYETKTIEVGLLKTLQKLRILDIQDSQMCSLPDSLFELVHLRYLCLDRRQINETPEAISHLANLQTLSISKCKSLSRLPNDITELLNLRCLRLDGSRVSHLPKGIGRLKILNHVEGFVVGENNDATRGEGCGLGELQSFSKMRFLKITRLESATMTGTSVLASNATFLRHLCLKWTKHRKKQQRRTTTHGGADREGHEDMQRTDASVNHRGSSYPQLPGSGIS